MNIKTLLEMNVGVKGLKLEKCEVEAVSKSLHGKGGIGKNGKQMPDWTMQFVVVRDESGSGDCVFSHETTLKQGDMVELHGIEIKEYKGQKQLSVKEAVVLTGQPPSDMPKFGTESALKVSETPKTSNTQEMWDNKEKRANMSMCLAYSKDLAVAGKIEVKDIPLQAKILFDTIYQDDFNAKDEMKEKQEIPFQ